MKRSELLSNIDLLDDGENSALLEAVKVEITMFIDDIEERVNDAKTKLNIWYDGSWKFSRLDDCKAIISNLSEDLY